MPKEKLKQSLNGLGREINAVEKPDDLSQTKLENLNTWVDTCLKNDSTMEPEETHGFVQDLQDASEHFEVSHPCLTDGINRVLVALSNMGI